MNTVPILSPIRWNPACCFSHCHSSIWSHLPLSLSLYLSLTLFLVLFSAKLASLPVICLSALPSLSVIAKAMIWLEDRQTDGQARRGEADSAVEGGVDGGVGLRAGGRVVRKWADPAGRCSGVTASPGWGSRCKALIAPRSLSLLCDRPLRSCPPPPRLQRGKSKRRERDYQQVMLMHGAITLKISPLCAFTAISKMSKENSYFQICHKFYGRHHYRCYWGNLTLPQCDS